MGNSMDLKSKIYIAGHTGLVGSALLRNLQNRGYTNIITRTHHQLDLTRQADTEEFFQKERPEYVFLAAALVGGIVANMTYKAEFIYQNLMIAANVIAASHKFGVTKLLNLSSSCTYPKAAPQPMKEEYLMTGPLEPTNEPYAVAKIAAMKLCRYYNERFGTNFISVMPSTLFGINDNFNLETSHVLPSLLRKFYLAKLIREKKFDLIRADIKKNPFGFGVDDSLEEFDDIRLSNALKGIGITSDYVLIWGTGKPLREFLYVDDLADACIFLMERYDAADIGEFINIGSGKDLMIKEIAAIAKNIVKFDGDIQHDTDKPDGMPRKLLENSKINNLGWKPKVELAEGMKRTYDWYVSRVNL
jgi:GDP-L-fucose synthase